MNLENKLQESEGTDPFNPYCERVVSTIWDHFIQNRTSMQLLYCV